MKHILTILALCLTISIKAQSFQTQILAGKQLKAVAEYSYASDKLYSYTYLETSEAYYWLQQIIQINIYKQWAAHAEYRTGDVFLAGVAKGFNIKDGYLSLGVLGRYENKLMPQVGAMWQYARNKIDIYGYVDIWKDTSVRLFLEQRFYYEVVKGVALGVVFNVMRYDDWEIVPYGGLKVVF